MLAHDFVQVLNFGPMCIWVWAPCSMWYTIKKKNNTFLDNLNKRKTRLRKIWQGRPVQLVDSRLDEYDDIALIETHIVSEIFSGGKSLKKKKAIPWLWLRKLLHLSGLIRSGLAQQPLITPEHSRTRAGQKWGKPCSKAVIKNSKKTVEIAAFMLISFLAAFVSFFILVIFSFFFLCFFFFFFLFCFLSLVL